MKDTKFMDTSAIAGTAGFYFQRLSTVNLHDTLTRMYFVKLLLTVTSRAELLATERLLSATALDTMATNRAIKAKREVY